MSNKFTPCNDGSNGTDKFEFLLLDLLNCLYKKKITCFGYEQIDGKTVVDMKKFLVGKKVEVSLRLFDIFQ